MPFGEIARILDRTPAATRQLASRARRRLRQGELDPRVTRLGEQRHVVDAFYEAVRSGDLERVLALLDPDLEMHNDGGPSRPEATVVVVGARKIADRAMHFARPDATLQPVVVNGDPGVLITRGDQPISLTVFTITHGTISRMDALVDTDRLRTLVVLHT